MSIFLNRDLFKTPFFIIKILQREKFKKYSRYFGDRVLDIGCGSKIYRRFISPNFYIGLDISKLSYADIIGNVKCLPFKDNSFDSVIITEVLEHIEEPLIALNEIERVLKSSGIVYLTVPMTWGLHYEPADFWRFTKYSLIYLFKRTNLKIINLERIGGVFSVVGARLADFLYALISKKLFWFIPFRYSEKIAMLAVFLFSFFFLYLAKYLDQLDDRDALGWMVLARNEK
ncbi:MAG: class I SAM-dependent methyltransferase [Candidatus Omnitrophica bacterium]|nr:class I SAM-dependent methyltransferase [Candidatus Omnitrophota bacterium]